MHDIYKGKYEDTNIPYSITQLSDVILYKSATQ